MTNELTLNEKLAQQLGQDPAYRIVRKLDSKTLFEAQPIPAGADVGIGLVLDTETTGCEDHDKIVELGMISFAYNRQTGQIYHALDRFNALEDPGMPISPEASAVNGITDDMVKGHRIDDDAVQSMVGSVDFVIAHNAGFDRPYCERRFSFFKAKKWACSYSQMDWAAVGVESSKLEYIAYRLGFFYDAHRAENDCLALLNALRLPLLCLNGTNAMALVLERMAKETRRIWATGAPFDAKDILKARGYRWSDGTKPDTEKAWNFEVVADELEAELAWLKENAFYRRQYSVPVDHTTPFNRFSGRRGQSERLYR